MTEEKREEAREGIARMREAAREVSRLNDGIHGRPPGVSAATLEKAVESMARVGLRPYQWEGWARNWPGLQEAQLKAQRAPLEAALAVLLASGELVPGRELEEALRRMQSVAGIAGQLDTPTGLFGREPGVQLAEYERRCAQAADELREIADAARAALAPSPTEGEQ